MNLCTFSLYLLTHFLLLVRCNNGSNRTSTVGYGGMVSSDHYLATQAGIEMLRKGGNAADAAIAVQTVLNVVRPFMCGIGGGAFIMYYDASTDQIYAIDGREEAPNAYHSQIFCKADKCFYDPPCNCTSSSETISMPERAYGGLSVGVPGTLSAFALLHDNFGTLDWSKGFENAINVAEQGFEMYEEFYNYLVPQNITALSRFNASRALYYYEDSPIANIGETFKNADLANTFRLLSNNSKQALEIFYKGEIANDIVSAAKNAINNVTGRYGLMTMEDISNYTAVFREPTISYYGNKYKIVGMNMPSSAITMQYILNMMHSLDNDEKLSNLTGFGLTNQSIYDGSTLHYLISLFNIAFSDRNKYMADSDFEDVPVSGLINATYNQQRAEQYLQETIISTPIQYGVPPGSTSLERDESESLTIEHGTSHFIVVDKDNNIACVTTTIERPFGSSVTVPGRGFALNNELTDFDALGQTSSNQTVNNGPEGGKKRRRTALDLFGRNGSNTYGGKRPRSSMSPTIVFNATTNQPLLAIGSPGGQTIIGSVFQALSKILLWNMDVQQSIDAPRLWSFNSPHVVIEPGFYVDNSNLTQQLTARGYNMQYFNNQTHGSVSAILFNGTYSNSDNSVNKKFMLYGGVDNLRVNTAAIMAVCNETETGTEILNEVNDTLLCYETTESFISKLSTTTRAVLITLFVIALLLACLIVVFRKQVRNFYHVLTSKHGLIRSHSYENDNNKNISQNLNPNNNDESDTKTLM